MSLNLQQGTLCRTELPDRSNVDFKEKTDLFQTF